MADSSSALTAEPGRGKLRVQAFPQVLQRAGSAACFAADELFSARISNAETRRAYTRAVGWFLEFCEHEEGRLFRFREKNGKRREIPVRDDLDEWIGEIGFRFVEANPQPAVRDPHMVFYFESPRPQICSWDRT